MAEADPLRPVTTPLRTTDLVRARAIEAVLGQSGLNHAGLVAEVRRRFGALDVEDGALVREPVIEGAAPFRTGERDFASCAGTLLHPDVIRAIADPKAEPYRFPAEVKPYLHQIEAWEHLTAEERRSVLVSSGTGSGKTECFLMPLLHDLATEAKTAGRLSGVRALALYPLNALIASQEERLRAWTAPFGGKIRFGLYNGLTPERLRATDKVQPEQAQDRKTLRNDPPPILVTNVTMLEYMTVRRVDRPLIENSRGKLRWIILDEAHGYVGSAAAEIALLIRRVLLTFGVSADQVRFVATSATIGGGTDVTEDLRRFLRDLSGAGEDRVKVVLGHRETVPLPPAGGSLVLSEAALGDPAALGGNPAVQGFVRAAEEGPLLWDQAERMLVSTGQPAERVIDAIAGQAGGRAPLLPLRVHSFLRAVPGLWSCLNPDCAGSPHEWPFGAIAVEKISACPHCESAVFEVQSCRECGEPYLDAVERQGKLHPRLSLIDQDEFAQASARDREEEDGESAEVGDDAVAREGFPDDVQRAIASRAMDQGRTIHVEPLTGRVLDRAGDDTRSFDAHDGKRCGHCYAEEGQGGALLRPFRFGAPFLIGNAAPVMLEGVVPHTPERQPAYRLPSEGRQLLSFTDSRQGTARFAANLQTNAERGFVRAFLYHSVQGSMAAAGEDDPGVASLRADIEQLEPLAGTAAAIADIVAQKKAELARKQQPSTSGIAWDDLRERLAGQPEVKHWMGKVWGYRDERYRDNPTIFAHFLMLREFARRPKRANTAETIGLARLRFDAIDRLSEERLPALLREHHRTIEEWRGFLSVLIDQVVRANFAIRAAWEDLHWLNSAKPLMTLCPPREDVQDRHQQRWPSIGAKGLPGNPALILEHVLRLDRSEKRDRVAINEVLEAAWDQLLPLFQTAGQSGYALDFGKAHVAPVADAWECPVTHRVLTATAFGLSPYGHRQGLKTAKQPAMPVRFPRLPIDFPTGARIEVVRTWTESDPDVARLREQGLWNNLHDRSALLSPYLRAAEHSAQQPASRLRRFEGEFKAGEINILNCSTTMEMGVDIGSVSAVMMTNVPPALANYRQRVGRAGRRGQGFAASLTYTRDTPLDRETFRDPQTYLQRLIRAPRVKLDSRRIVQRHVNALLLARWFAGEGGEAMKTEAGLFFGAPDEVGAEPIAASPAATCLAWLDAPSTITAMAGEIAALTAGTVLAGDRTVHAEAAAALAQAQAAFLREWQALQDQATQVDKAAAAGIQYQLRRLTKENLLKELAVRAVLPGHGFPTDVVPFVNRDKPASDEQGDEEGARQHRRTFPTRNLDIAIRDYAPGAEVVVDGLVYRSAGVTLNWTRPADDAAARQIQSIKTFWHCKVCGAADCGHAAPDHCPSCHADIGINDRRAYLEPAGFTVDMAKTPHADTDLISYVEPEPEQIIARGAGWAGFADPTQGRLRTSHEGLVFYSSMGAAKSGYRICLECGRAEPARGDGEPVLVGHTPLRGTKRGADGLCPGNSKPFKITRDLALGHEVFTDVAELQPVGVVSEGAGWALISAMREALARRLGVEAGEMGMSVRAAQGAIGQKTWSLFLYDRNAGGAGFAPQAAPMFEDLLRDSETILDCGQPGCEMGCSACVLTADLFQQQLIIDRKAALACVRAMRGALATPLMEDLAVPDAGFSRSMIDEIAVAVDRGAQTVTVWADPALDIATLAASDFARFARRIEDRGALLDFVVSPEWLATLDPAARLALRDAAQSRPFTLRQGKAPVFVNGAIALAAVSGSNAMMWATRDPLTLTLGADWGRGVTAPVVCFARDTLPLSTTVNLATLLPASGTSYVEIASELDGTIAEFGERFVRHLLPAIRKAGVAKPGTLRRIEYGDRYLHAPLPVRLALGTIAAFRDALGDPGVVMPVTLVTDPLKANERQPYRPTHNWQWPEDRADVLEGLSKALDLDLAVTERGAPHGRFLTLHFDDRPIRIVLDQGFGPWETPSYAKFDFGVTGDAQAVKLAAYSAVLAARGKTYAVVTA